MYSTITKLCFVVKLARSHERQKQVGLRDWCKVKVNVDVHGLGQGQAIVGTDQEQAMYEEGMNPLDSDYHSHSR